LQFSLITGSLFRENQLSAASVELPVALVSYGKCICDQPVYSPLPELPESSSERKQNYVVSRKNVVYSILLRCLHAFLDVA
jgi:hypothetical protein